MFDVETLGKRSNAVILSLAVTHFDPDGKPSPDELRKNTFFIKFDAEDQIKRLKRSVTPSSIDWWKNQCENVKRKSVYPTPIDAVFEQGYEEMRQWAAQYKEPKSWVWARGNLDQLVIDDIEEQLGLNPVFPFSRWRECLSTEGYYCSRSACFISACCAVYAAGRFLGTCAFCKATGFK